MGNFNNLKSLFLNQNRLSFLPDSVGHLEKLECLSVSYNFLETLPDSLMKLKSLREVKLAANRFYTFPEQLAGLAGLELLDLSANLIEDFKTENVDLGGLMAYDLNLNENCISKISEDLAKAPRLKVLRLQNNRLTLNSFPDSLLGNSQVSIVTIFHVIWLCFVVFAQVCHILVEGNMFEPESLKTLDGFESYVERYVHARKDSMMWFTFRVGRIPETSLCRPPLK